MGSHVALDRQFLPATFSQKNTETDDYYWDTGFAKGINWADLDDQYRCVILAEGGSGKTEELLQHAQDLSKQAKLAFFIRIEDIAAGFAQAFDVGDEEQFQDWLKSTDEAWFFLDSVDEARLDSPKAFEKALRVFAKAIKPRAHKAHIYISSRPYSWRPTEDTKLLDEFLFYPAEELTEKNKQPDDLLFDSAEGETEDKKQPDDPQFYPTKVHDREKKREPVSALTIYTLQPLDKGRIRRFCEARDVVNIDALMKEIERANVWGLAERPFDLEGILSKWEDDKTLGSRLVMLRHNLDKQLRDAHNTNRAYQQPLNLELGKKGSRCLAAAVILTGKVDFNVPDSTFLKPGIDADVVLADWLPGDVHALLERGIFSNKIYGSVRFRNRDMRELLAAEWLESLLQNGGSRREIEHLIFRQQYGESIITPTFRPILPWLILLDNDICRKTFEHYPEIAIEGGDPSQLPLQVRKNILSNIVQRIVNHTDDRSSQDNSAIARIAHTDLSGEVLALITTHHDNDDAMFFLARLVWQGNLSGCVDPFIAVTASNTSRIYTRIVAARAVMACGSEEQKRDLWQTLNESNTHIPRKLLAELLNEATLNEHTVNQLLHSLGKLEPYERYASTGLSRALGQFIEQCSINQHDESVINLLMDGLDSYLEKAPYIERHECHVSKEFAWLMSSATQLVERLVVARSEIALGTTALSILLKVPALRFWSGSEFREHKGQLPTLVPEWPELNDALYWASFDQARAIEAEKGEKISVGHYGAFWLEHYWAFDENSLPRLFDFIQTRDLPEDKLIALTSAFQVYVRADRSDNILSSIHNEVSNNDELKVYLDSLLNPTMSDTQRKMEERQEEREREQAEMEAKQKQNHDKWVSKLRNCPECIYNPDLKKPTAFNYDHYWLMRILDNNSLSNTRTAYANWQGLAEEFGQKVAIAYRDAAVNYWRHYTPTITSETNTVERQTPYELLFAMAGLEIEADENPAFPQDLTPAEALNALRYITWELNGFPKWFERLSVAFPELTLKAVLTELEWDLAHTKPDKPTHYIISDVVNHAPWLHTDIAPVLLKWFKTKPEYLQNNRHHCLHILVNGETEPAVLASLAAEQISLSGDNDSKAVWYALYVDSDPDIAIPELEEWLSQLDRETATQAAQVFITALLGGRYWHENTPNVGNFQASEHLMKLFILMNRHIRTSEDISHSDGKVYTPGLRDDAQEARNTLFRRAAETPGKAGYTFIKQVAHEQTEPAYEAWMLKEAYKRAELDGDLEPFTAQQVREFEHGQTITPATHRQLYDLALQRLKDLKHWVERGNDSPWKTWQDVKEETQMRTLIAGQLGQTSHGRYTIAQEPELANRQRMDITLSNPHVPSPVPIELKLLDKGWSGPKLCERLYNQLVCDYLREESAGCGVMLLVWLGNKPEKKWIINGHRVGLNELGPALEAYWLSIAGNYPGIEAIEVVVVNVSIRATVSST